MKLTQAQYDQYVKTISPNSKTAVNTLRAFWVGGLICLLGEGLKQGFLHAGLDERAAGMLVPASLIFLAAILTALHVFDDIGRFAGAGAMVPITGFANAMVSPAIEFRTEGLIAGVAFKMFTISGPVLVFGIAAAVLAGLIERIIQLFL